MSPLTRYLFETGASYLLRILLYRGAFKYRSVACSFGNCLVIAGSFILARLLPLPQFIYLLTTIGVSLALIAKFTDAKLYPDAVLISIGVELTSIFAMDYLIAPLIL